MSSGFDAPSASRFLPLRFKEDVEEVIRLAAAACGTPAAALFLENQVLFWVRKPAGVGGRTCLSSAARAPERLPHGLAPAETSLALQVPASADRAGGFRFYAGVPLHPAKSRFGLLCVLEERARIIAPEQATALRLFARQVTRLAELAATPGRARDVEAQRRRIRAQSHALCSLVGYLTEDSCVPPPYPNRHRTEKPANLPVRHRTDGPL